MNELEKKLPLRTEVTVDDTYQYTFFDGVDKQPRPTSHSEKIAAYPMVVEWINWQKEAIKRNDTDTSREMQEYFVEAKVFIEQLTGYDLSTVGLAASDGGSYTMYFSAIDNKIRTTIDVTLPEYLGFTAEQKRQIFTADLVHELMHATGNNNLKCLGVQDAEGCVYATETSGLHSVDMRAPIVQAYIETGGTDSPLVGHFFEEAAAEEAASRWREANVKNVIENGTVVYQPDGETNSPKLPPRFVYCLSINQDTEKGYFMANSAYPAAGLYAISNYTGVDIFQLILDSRNPEKEAAARRKIVQAIESVQVGLYPKLRDIIYTQESFSQGYEMILSAIDMKKHQSSKLGSGVLART